MVRTSKSASPSASATPEAQLREFIQKFSPSHQALIRGLRKVLRTRIPGANELVYDNYNFFVIGYSPTERPSDAVISLAAAAKGVSLCFIHGARLPDPGKLLLGSGKQTRFIRIDAASALEKPEVSALVTAAVVAAPVPFVPGADGRLVIRSVSAKQRARRTPDGGPR